MCNVTGQYVNLGYGYAGVCTCAPYNYWIGGLTGCTAQLSQGDTCTSSTANPSQCLDESGLYCDSITLKCTCLSNYYWFLASKKCCKIEKL